MANTGRLRPKGLPFAGVRCCIAVLASPYKHLLNIFAQLGSNKKREIRKSQQKKKAEKRSSSQGNWRWSNRTIALKLSLSLWKCVFWCIILSIKRNSFFRNHEKCFTAFWNFYFTNLHEVQTVLIHLLKLRQNNFELALTDSFNRCMQRFCWKEVLALW